MGEIRDGVTLPSLTIVNILWYFRIHALSFFFLFIYGTIHALSWSVDLVSGYIAIIT